MESDETPAQAIDTRAPEASWRERANSKLEKIIRLFSPRELPDLCANAQIEGRDIVGTEVEFG